MSLNKKITILLLGMTYSLLYSTSALAQNRQQITLLDENSLLPIERASYQYGAQSGFSDINGTLSFVFKDGESMQISHLKYGSWEWNSNEIQEIILQKMFLRKSTIVSLHPVTVIAVRSNKNPDERINMDYQDRMEHDGAAILNQIPAISNIKKSGNYGFDPVFRGFKYDQLNIVLNGAQSATAACPNRMDPPTSQMAPNMMDRIEILKGPYALRYGAGLGATINFIPSKPRFSEYRQVYGRFSSAYQSNNNVLRGEGKIGFSSRSYDLGFFGAWSQGDDYEAGNGETVPADFQRGSFGTNLDLKLASNQKLKVSAIYNLARDVDFPALQMDLRTDDTWMFNARHDIYLNKKHLESWNTTIFSSFVNHLMDNGLKSLSPRMLNAKTDANTYNYGGRTEGAWYFPKGNLFAGLDLRIEGAKGIREREFLMGPNAGKILYDNAWQDGRISKTGIFGEYHLESKIFQYILSARIEINDALINDPSDEFTEVYPETHVRQINPSISAGMVKIFKNNFETGLWLGRVQRSGSLSEKFINYFAIGQDPYEMLGNPLLKPEVNNQLDLTFKWANEKTALNLDLFVSYLQNYISSVIDSSLSPSLPMSPGVRQFINIDEAFKTGFEINWKQDIAFGLTHQMGVAYTYAQDLSRDEPLPEIAPLDFRYTLMASYFKGKLHPKATFRHVLEQSRVSSEFGESVTPAFTLLDVKVSYQVSEQVWISTGANNLLNSTYYEHLNRAPRGNQSPIYERGRNIFASVNINFN